MLALRFPLVPLPLCRLLLLLLRVRLRLRAIPLTIRESSYLQAGQNE
jgi:hypothetical protein